MRTNFCQAAHLALLILLILALPASNGLAASAPAVVEFNIEALTTEVRKPTLAYDNQSDFFLVAWGDQNGYIFGRTVTWPKIVSGYLDIGTQTTDDRANPDLAFNTTDKYFLGVWEQYKAGIDSHTIYGRKYHPDQSLGDEFNLLTATPLAKGLYHPAVAYSSTSNKFLAVWECHVGDLRSIEGSFIPGSGAMTPNFVLAQGDASWSYYTPDVAYLASNDQFLVVWMQEDRGTGHTFISARRIAADGTILDVNSMLIAAQPLDELNPAVAALPLYPGMGGYAVIWEYDFDPADHDIYAALVSWDGVVSPYFGVHTDGNTQYHPAIASDRDSDTYLAVWGSKYPGMANYGIYGQAISVSGVLLGMRQVIGGLAASRPAVAGLGGGGYLVAYEELPFFGNLDIWGRYWGNNLFVPTLRR
ncbi:MAG: hypothetical protein JXB15_06125 [Anaerolineales bacterium]|nr:hypothetical protein [Anaerolineales bacterium]